MNDTPAIKLDNVTVRYGSFTAIEQINLTVEQGEIVSVVGPNGGGKTTLLHVVLGFVKPAQGTVEVLGASPAEMQSSGRIGYLPQSFEHDRRFPLSAWDVTAMSRYAMQKWGRPLSAADIQAVDTALEMVGLSAQRGLHFGSLSGGQKQRVLIARALAGEPDLLILDEPSTGLDAVAQDSFYRLLQEIREKRGLTILMVSHDVGTVSGFVDQVACLSRQLHYHGKADGALTPEIVERVFGKHMHILVHDEHCQTCESDDE